NASSTSGALGAVISQRCAWIAAAISAPPLALRRVFTYCGIQVPHYQFSPEAPRRQRPEPPHECSFYAADARAI
ncbi:MAG: hypothetical protein ACM3IK_05205, partial [Sphingomonadaceae bacterium]